MWALNRRRNSIDGPADSIEANYIAKREASLWPLKNRLTSSFVIILLHLIVLIANATDPTCLRSDATLRIDCHPDTNGKEQPQRSECLRRGCCWLPDESGSGFHVPPLVGKPSCFFPADFDCYDVLPILDKDDDDAYRGKQWWRATVNQVEVTDGEASSSRGSRGESEPRVNLIRLLLSRKSSCPASGFPGDADRINVELGIYGDSLINIKISELHKERFEPVLPKISLPARKVMENVEILSDSVANITSRAPINTSEAGESGGETNVSGFKITYGRLTIEWRPASTLKVTHTVSGKMLFETDFGKMIYSDRFIQLPTYLASGQVYGLGQHLSEGLLKSSGRDYAKLHTMFNYGQPPGNDGRSAYSSFPFYINLAQLNDRLNNTIAHDLTAENARETFESRRKLMATGALMLNSNAMDVLVHSGEQTGRPGITWRLVGGIVNLFLFTGPQPHDVIHQYQSLVGKPTLPPVWALGYHQSRLNYRDLAQIKLAWARTRSAGIPMESVWTDLEFLWRGTSYTLNNLELNDLVKIMQDEFDMHYVPLVDPFISTGEELDTYEALRLAIKMKMFATNPQLNIFNESSPALVKTWTDSGISGLIDFTNPRAVEYLSCVLSGYRSQLSFDGLWLDMNEPEIFENLAMEDVGGVCAFDEKLPYLPGGRNLTDRTVCMSADFSAGKHFDIHNLYAFYQSKAHYDALKQLDPTKRPFIISRSQFPGQGKYSGTWLGDMGSSFEQARTSTVGVIEANWFGQPLVGADICGFFGSTTDELCARWFSFGAFYPFARNHNEGSARDQDPGALGEEVQLAARVAMLKRYSLLPYLYSLFYENHLKGEPVVRSVEFELFDQYYLTASLDSLPKIDNQLMWGSALMIAPILESGVVSRSVYLAPGRWYDVSIGLPGTEISRGPFDALKSNWPTSGDGQHLIGAAQDRINRLRKPIECINQDGCWLRDLYTPLGAINIFMRGGWIVPTFRRVDHTNSIGMNWKRGTLFLEVALNSNDEAFGTSYWDSGESDPEAREYSMANFWVSHSLLSVVMVEDNYKEPMKIDGFIVYGVDMSSDQPDWWLEYRGVELHYSYDHDRRTLTCLFKSPMSEEPEPLELKRYDKLRFDWSAT